MPPLTKADLTRPAPVALTLELPPRPLARNVINPKETVGATLGKVAQSEEDPNMRQWKSPAGKVGSEAFDELLALWTAIPQGCHFAWYRGLELLKGSTREGVTTEDLLLFMNQLMERVRRDTGFIADIMSKALEGSVPGGEELSHKLPKALARCLGIAVEKQAENSTDIWNTTCIPLAEGRREEAILDISELLDNLQRLQRMVSAETSAHIRDRKAKQIMCLWKMIQKAMVEVGAEGDKWLVDWKKLAAQYGEVQKKSKKD
ncbi:hypothetical protein A9Z42_0032350 [Trichoderma parareesei]|uniref:Uncharacterized protein n=1 Tax=Trichoderma parareesei TaxID=858221 RepID=A0A2H2Z4Z8_TRIPA|nr:hypothetical protein A9Z42_0032350 [Trichoderma parareesei]